MSTEHPQDRTPDPRQAPPRGPKLVRPPLHPARPPAEDTDASPAAAHALTDLAQELSGLLDGSLRWLGLAERTLPDGQAASDERVAAARDQIDHVRASLERMNGLVGAALRSGAVPIGSPLLGAGSAVTLGEAVDHAADVVRPLAAESGVHVRVTIEPAAGRLPAGPLYTVILNALRHAVQSMQDVCRPGAVVSVHAAGRRDADGHPWVELTIEDEGPGVATGERAGGLAGSFGGGLGLGLCRRIVADMGGHVELSNRSADGRERGARLRVRVPAPRDLSDTLIG